MNQPKDTLFLNEGAWRAAGQDTFIRKHVFEVVTTELVTLKPSIDPDGTGYLYWYVTPFGDTLALDQELSTFEYEMPILMKQPFRDSDTIQPSDYVHGVLQPSYPFYPVHIHPVDNSGDAAFGAAMFPVLVLITVSFLYRMVIGGHLAKLKSDLKDAWNPTSASRSV